MALFQAIDSICSFDLDVCATPENAKCAQFYTIATDGLNRAWEGTCWMNPPYGRIIGKWMQKAFQESRKPHTTVICLVPARTDTLWWHRYAMPGQILFLRGRLKFINRTLPSYRSDGVFKTSSAPFPSAIIILGGNMKLWSRLQKQLTAAGVQCG